MIEGVGCPDAIQSRVMEWCSLTETNVTFSEGWEIWGFTVKNRNVTFSEKWEIWGFHCKKRNLTFSEGWKI